MTPHSLSFTAAVLSTFMLSACETSCDGVSSDPVRYEDGRVDAKGTQYATSPFEGPYLHFPPGRVFDLVHDFGSLPSDVAAFLSFHAEPFQVDEKPHRPGFAEAAGDLAVFTCADGQVLRVENTTCETFYLRVTAELSDFSWETPASPLPPCSVNP